MDRKAITVRLDRVLRPLGFARRGTTWNRKAGSVVDVVAVQISKTGESFTLNLGVLDPDAYMVCWGEPPGERVDETRCTVRIRLTEPSTRTELWWHGSDDRTLEAVEIALVGQGLAFLDAHRSVAAMEHFLGSASETRQPYPPPVVYRAALKARSGDRKGACALLHDLQRQTSDAWRAKVEAALTRLACE